MMDDKELVAIRERANMIAKPLYEPAITIIKDHATLLADVDILRGELKNTQALAAFRHNALKECCNNMAETIVDLENTRSEVDRLRHELQQSQAREGAMRDSLMKRRDFLTAKLASKEKLAEHYEMRHPILTETMARLDEVEDIFQALTAEEGGAGSNG